MRIYCNRLPIHFGEQGIPCLSHGFFADKAPPTCFEHRGQYLEWLEGEIGSHAASSIIWLHPADLSGQIQSYLLAGIRNLLAKSGDAALRGDHVAYGSGGRVTLIRVEVDLARAGIWLLLYPESRTELPNPENLKASVAALSGMRLGPYAGIGSWEPIADAPNTLPDLIFSEDGTQHHTIAAEGIREFGPVSRKEARFSRPLHVVWIARRSNGMTMSHFLSDFTKGMKGVHEANKTWGDGWGKTYRLQGVCLHELLVDDSVLGVRKPLQELLERLRAEGKEVGLLLYEKEEIHARLEIFCLQQALPYHRIVTSEFVPRGTERAKLLETLGLVLYAKLGGSPWHLPLPKTLHRQYVVGIGSETQGNGLLGYATVFGAQGNYHLGEAKWAASDEAWNEGLARFVTNQIRGLHTMGEIGQGDHVDIVFHLDRPWEEGQRQAIKEALEEAFGGKFVLGTSFVHLGFDHPYHLWEEGVTAVPSGVLHTLGDRQRLLQLGDGGASLLPQRPVLATLLEGSDAGDFGFLCYQIHTFASLSWTGVRRTSLPASLLYGQRIANKVALLRAEAPDLHIPEAFKSIPWYL